MTTVACALFVKNECSDIAGWIAWHLALGVDHLFIFEDHSTDGTWEIIQAAARSFPITAVRTDPVAQPDFYWRQRDSFMAAAAQARGRYDWIGFLDGDEYVYLNRFDRIGDFLDQFPQADGVAINWCIYGNNGRVVRPRQMAVEAFTRHGTTDLNDNVLVKSFVRPEKLRGNYTDPHRYDIDPERYVDARGEVVRWEGATKPIDWRDAKVLHFVCRSMEQYIQRIRRRLNADLGDSTVYWDHFNRNDVEDLAPLRLLPATYERLRVIYANCLDEGLRTLWEIGRAVTPDPLLAAAALRQGVATPVTAPRGEIRTVVFRTHSGTLLCVDRDGVVLDVALEALDGREPVLGAIHSSTPELVTLYAPERGRLWLRGDTRLLDQPVLRIRAVEGQAGVFVLQSTHTGQYLAAPPEGRGSGVECNRNAADEWERFRLEPVTASHTPDLGDVPVSDTPVGLTALALCRWLGGHARPVSRGTFLRALARLAPVERERVEHLAPGLLTPFF